MRSKILVLLGAGLALLLAGCGGSGGSAGGSGNGPLKGANLTVGSKEFTESIILGKITELALQNAGASVSDKTGISGSSTVRAALTSGNIDMYWDYTGTGWVDYLKHTTSNVPSNLYQQVKSEDLKKNGIVWLKPAPFQDTYAIAVKKPFAQQNNLSTMSDAVSYIKSHPSNGAVCAASEFINRDDGLPGLEKAYNFKFTKVVTLDLSLIYAEIGKKCAFGEVFSTDGRIISQNLQTLNDDQHFFVPYNGALTLKKQTLDKYPKIKDVMAPITAKLTNSTVTKLNSEVDVQGKQPEDVAKTWLQDNGFLS